MAEVPSHSSHNTLNMDTRILLVLVVLCSVMVLTEAATLPPFLFRSRKPGGGVGLPTCVCVTSPCPCDPPGSRFPY